ncbi:MAG: redoxin domain-containing protein [Gemmata sp.]
MRAGTVLVAGALAAALAGAQEPKRQPGSLKVGDTAPAFELADADGKNPVKLADLKGKPVVLVFGSCT